MTTGTDTARIAAADALEQVIGDATALQRQKGMVSDSARDVHRSLLRFFERHARLPADGDLTELSAEAGLRPETLRAALAELADADLVIHDERGEVISAYPYSGRPTRHRVEFAGGESVHAMCAIDALGIPLMTARDATVFSSDPSNGQAVRVTVRDGVAQWDPVDAGVFVARRLGNGSVAETCCQVIDFFASPDAATRFHEGRETQGIWLDQAQAFEAGRLAFGAMLEGTDRDEACRC